MEQVTAAAKLRVLHSSARHDWQTPACVLERVRRVGEIDLDPCTTDDNPVGARNWIAPPEDGLKANWSWLDGIVFVNPPYGREIEKWTNKCRATCDVDATAQIVALVPSRTDTEWFKFASRSATARCFWYGRITFVGAEHGAPFPSALFYWGPRPHRFCDAFADTGEVHTL